MKTLIIFRHAKAEKNDLLKDYDRGLTDRGKTDALEMSKRLLKKDFKPDLIISSPAKRTYKTARILANHLGYDEKNIDLNSQIYQANVEDLLFIIRELDDKNSNVILVGHNPTVTGIIGYLTPNFIEHLPTSGFAQIQFDMKTWKMIKQLSGNLSFVDFPSNDKSI
jgi:phosphohistidine phosphatase